MHHIPIFLGRCANQTKTGSARSHMMLNSLEVLRWPAISLSIVGEDEEIERPI